MRLNVNSSLVPILVSSVVSAAVDKLVAHDYAATRSQLGSLQSMIKANASQLGTLTGNVATLRSGVTMAGASASQAQSMASQANSQLTTLTPIVRATAERLYDTCVLTSSLWQRSFPGIDGNSGTSWTASLANESGGSDAASSNGLDRCYSASAGQNGTALGGMLPSFAQPDDAYTATPPTG